MAKKKKIKGYKTHTQITKFANIHMEVATEPEFLESLVEVIDAAKQLVSYFPYWW